MSDKAIYCLAPDTSKITFILNSRSLLGNSGRDKHKKALNLQKKKVWNLFPRAWIDFGLCLFTSSIFCSQICYLHCVAVVSTNTNLIYGLKANTCCPGITVDIPSIRCLWIMFRIIWHGFNFNTTKHHSACCAKAECIGRWIFEKNYIFHKLARASIT